MLTDHLRRRVLAPLAVASVLLPLPIVVSSVVEANRYLVTPDQVVGEDMYVLSNSAQVDGLIDGDLVIASNAVSIVGTVTGDVFVASLGSVDVSGEVQGSVRGVARSVTVSGAVGDELAVVAGATTVTGSVGRDVLVFTGSLDLDGTIGRDVRGRTLSFDLDGRVGRDVDIAVQSTFGGRSLAVGPTAVVEGDFQYRSGRDLLLDPEAEIRGLTTRLPTRPAFSTEIVLRIARVLTVMGFLLGGMAILWLFRSTGPGAESRVRVRPWASLLVGLGMLVLLPTVGAVLAATLVGIPLALLLLFFWLLLLFFGPMPALAAGGRFLVRGRGGIYGGFLAGSVAMFLLLWVFSPLGLLVYLAALLSGMGGWAIAGWEHRDEHDEGEADSAAAPGTGGPAPEPAGDDWEPPLPPAPPLPQEPPEAGDGPADGGGTAS